MNHHTIEQAAKDYDMNIEDVKRIYQSGGNFYKKLEEFICNRRGSIYELRL
jgi:hypothetical protein